MKRKIVLKRLSASDLTLFEHHFRLTAGTKQKAFNLDAAIFISSLYPGLPERMEGASSRIPLDLHIYGPGMAPIHNLQRKILKQDKNWRMDGELIYNPPENDTRFNALQKNDFAIFEFFGATEPQSARLYLVAKEIPEDKGLHSVLDKKYSAVFSPRKGMEPLILEDLLESIGLAGLPDGHPVLDFIDAPDLEDAVLGGYTGTKSLRARRKARGVSQDEFERAKKGAEATGQLGEAILNSQLKMMTEQGEFSGYTWDSSRNAVSPFDFTIIEKDGTIRRIDAKSSSGEFSNPIHISTAELFEMAEGQNPYDIYRLFFVEKDFALLRIAKDMKAFASSILPSIQALPEGVKPDGFSVKPEILDFGNEIILDCREDDGNQVDGATQE